MVRKENKPSSGKSLLLTATSKRFGPGRFASLVARGTAKPPVKKVKFSSSDASRMSEMTASVVEEVRPAVVKEVKVEDIDVESSILGMSVISGQSSYFGKESPLLGNENTLTPQPRAHQLPPKKESISLGKKKAMDIHNGITLNAPSPMSLSRVQVQISQERTAPPSKEWQQEDVERMKIEDQRREKEEFKNATKEAAKKFNEEMHNEIGEGFETQLEDTGIEPYPKKKSLMKKFLKKIRPKKPMTKDAARVMAREAIIKSKSSQNTASGKPPLAPGDFHVIPLEEITMGDHEESVSDLDSFAKKNFPVAEINMDGEDSRDDSSVSSLGTQHILERMGPGPLLTRGFQGERRDPVSNDDLEAIGRQQMFNPKTTPALIDRIDSGNMTEKVHQGTNGGRENPKSLGMLAAAMCMAPGFVGGSNDGVQSSNDFESGEEAALQAALAHIKKATAGDHDKSSQYLKKSLSPIEEGDGMSPRNGGIPRLEDSENPMYGRYNTKRGNQGGARVIDLTDMASPMSAATQDGVKGGPFNFDDIVDMAESKLKMDGDRYALERDSSPSKHGTPKARGGKDQFNALADGSSPQSSFEVYEHPEGDVVMWSEGSVQEKKVPGTKKDIPGNFSDGLFDLLSTDESVSRGRKKIPFLLEKKKGADDEDSRAEQHLDEFEAANACMFDLSLGACGKEPNKNLMKTGNNNMPDGSMMDPKVGVMCGAVPLYFMYKDQEKTETKRKNAGSVPVPKGEYIRIQDEILARAANQPTIDSLPKVTQAKPNYPKVLLDKDDAYWDTLSTIASTKDKSAASIPKIALSNNDATPGPIPVEITTTKKAPSSPSVQTESEVDKAIGNLSKLIHEDDNKSIESLSKELAAIARGNKSQKEDGEACNKSKDQEKETTPIADGSDRLEMEDTKNHEHLPGQSDAPNENANKTLSREDDLSVDNSELLLAVTRSEGNDPATSPNNAQSPRESSGWQVRGMSKPFRISEENLQKASSALRSYLPKSPRSPAPKPIYSSLRVHSKREGMVSSPSKPDPKPESLADRMRENIFVNPWKNSTRSVSWGVEEIYEATSPTNASAIDAPQVMPNNQSQITASGAEIQSQPELHAKVGSPRSHSTQSQSGNSSSQLSAKDEQELISRTLMLSKELLSTMTPQELGVADDDFMKTLMSFGTEDGKSSLVSPGGKTVDSSREISSLGYSEHSSVALTPLESNPHDTTTGIVKPLTPTTTRPIGPLPELFVKESAKEAHGHAEPEPDSIQPSASGRSEDSPIDIEGLFNKYDNLANHLIGENVKLQGQPLRGVNDENTTLSSNSPRTLSRLDQLRAKRAEAMAKLKGGKEHQFGTRASIDVIDVGRSKDRVSVYAQRNPRAVEIVSRVPLVPRSAPTDDIDTVSTRSATSTPSMKARELRKQLDEALKASRSIKESQDQLGSELERFKNRFYQKNDALEDQAVRAIGNL